MEMDERMKQIAIAKYVEVLDATDGSWRQGLYAAMEAVLMEREELGKEDLAAKITKLEGYIEELQANRLNAAYVIETLRKENAELRESEGMK
ncbi:MAG TPA: hypothetical protein VMV57_02225 [Terracidiphilus sp.]|nr:hypothetical protein [Terracidiphilus sp.]